MKKVRMGIIFGVERLIQVFLPNNLDKLINLMPLFLHLLFVLILLRQLCESYLWDNIFKNFINCIAYDTDTFILEFLIRTLQELAS